MPKKLLFDATFDKQKRKPLQSLPTIAVAITTADQLPIRSIVISVTCAKPGQPHNCCRNTSTTL